MKLKCDLEAVEMEDEIICVPVGSNADAIHGILKMNKSGKQILDMLKEETDVEHIVKKITEKYDNDPAQICIYVNKIVDILRDAGLID